MASGEERPLDGEAQDSPELEDWEKLAEVVRANDCGGCGRHPCPTVDQFKLGVFIGAGLAAVGAIESALQTTRLAEQVGCTVGRAVGPEVLRQLAAMLFAVGQQVAVAPEGISRGLESEPGAVPEGAPAPAQSSEEAALSFLRRVGGSVMRYQLGSAVEIFETLAAAGLVRRELDEDGVVARYHLVSEEP